MLEMTAGRRVLVALAGIAAILLLIGATFLLLLVSISVLNAELYGRITETLEIPAPLSKSEDDPQVRLVIHRALPDENAVEASLVLIVDRDSELGKEIASAGGSVKAIVDDGSSPHMYAMTAETPQITVETFESGWGAAVARSERFQLPMFPSMGSYPFDDIRVRPMLRVRTNRGALLAFRAEVQKALPGRMLSVSGDALNVVVRLTRTPVEKAFVLTASSVFFLLSLAVTFSLFVSRAGLSSVEQLIAVAGYLLAAAGFRELLGVGRIPATTILEIVILGVPLVLLSLGLAISTYRGRRILTGKEAESAGPDRAAGSA